MKFSLSNLFAIAVLAVAFAFGLATVGHVYGGAVAVGLLLVVHFAASSFSLSSKLGAGSSVFGHQLADKDLSDTPALPNGAATAYSAAFKLGPGVHPEGVEIEITIPDATTTEAPDTRTLTVDVVAGDTSTPTTAANLARVFTGAGGAGFTGATWRTKVASTAGDYIRLRMVGGASFGNMSAKTATFRVLQ